MWHLSSNRWHNKKKERKPPSPYNDGHKQEFDGYSNDGHKNGKPCRHRVDNDSDRQLPLQNEGHRQGRCGRHMHPGTNVSLRPSFFCGQPPLTTVWPSLSNPNHQNWPHTQCAHLSPSYFLLSLSFSKVKLCRQSVGWKTSIVMYHITPWLLLLLLNLLHQCGFQLVQ